MFVSAIYERITHMDNTSKENLVEAYLNAQKQYHEEKLKENWLVSEVEQIRGDNEETLQKIKQAEDKLNEEIKDIRSNLKKEIKKQQKAADCKKKMDLIEQLEEYLEEENGNIERSYNEIRKRRSEIITRANKAAELYLNEHLLPLLPQAESQIISDNQGHISQRDLDSARSRYVKHKNLEQLKLALKNGTYQSVTPKIDFLSYFRKPKTGDSGAYEWIDIAKSFMFVGVGTAIIRNVLHFLFGWLGNLWAQLFPDFVNLVSGILNVLGYGPLFIAAICLIIAIISSILHIEIEQPFDDTVSKQLHDSDIMLYYLVAIKDFSIIELIRESVIFASSPLSEEYQLLLEYENNINNLSMALDKYEEDAENALANNNLTFSFKMTGNRKENSSSESLNSVGKSEGQTLAVKKLMGRLKECEVALYKVNADNKDVQISFKNELEEKQCILEKTRIEIQRLVKLMNDCSKEWVSLKPDQYLVTVPSGFNLGLTPDPDNNDGLTDYWNIINHKSKALVFNYDSSNEEHGLDIIRNFIVSFLMNTTGTFLYYNLYYFNEDQTQSQIMKSPFIRNSRIAKNNLNFINESDKKFLENAGGVFRKNAKTTIAETNITELKNGQATIFDPMNIKKYQLPIIRIDKKYANFSLLQQVSRNAVHWGVIPIVFIDENTVEQTVLDSEFVQEARKDGRYYDIASELSTTVQGDELYLNEEDFRKLGRSLVRVQPWQKSFETNLLRELTDEIMNDSHTSNDDIEIDEIFEQPIETCTPEKDSLYDDVVAFIKDDETVSISKLQRRFRIGYNRAACLMDVLEESGIVEQAEDGNGYRVSNLENAF